MYLFMLISTGLKAGSGQCELFTYRNIRYYLAWAAGNGDHMHGICTLHNIPRAWEQQG